MRPGVYAAEVRPRLGRTGPDDPGGIAPVRTAEFTINGPYSGGWVLADGTVRPPQSWVDEAGKNCLVHWGDTAWAVDGDELGPLQALWARGLYTPAPPAPPRPPRPHLDVDGHGDLDWQDPIREMTAAGVPSAV